jgi:hypothetical protein
MKNYKEWSYKRIKEKKKKLIKINVNIFHTLTNLKGNIECLIIWLYKSILKKILN